jgi:hypothetical protein
MMETLRGQRSAVGGRRSVGDAAWPRRRCSAGLLRTACYLLLLHFTAGTCTAQSTGTVRLMIDPGHDFQFVVDHKYRMQQREVKLGEGLHHFSLWAPERMVVDTALFVVADRSVDLVVRLPYSPEYIAYRDALVRYQNGRKLRLVAPVLFGAGVLWTGLSYRAYDRALDQIETDREAYTSSTDPGRIADLKDQRIPEHKQDLRRARTSLILGGSLTALGAGVWWYVLHRTKNFDAPRFEDREKVRFEGLTWMPTTRGGVWAAGITIPLAR